MSRTGPDLRYFLSRGGPSNVFCEIWGSPDPELAVIAVSYAHAVHQNPVCMSFTRMPMLVLHTHAHACPHMGTLRRPDRTGAWPRVRLCPCLSAATSFLCLGSYKPGSGARLPRGFPRSTQIMRGNTVTRSQKARGTSASMLGHHSSACILCLCSGPAVLRAEMSPSGCPGLPVALLALLFCPGEPAPGVLAWHGLGPRAGCLLSCVRLRVGLTLKSLRF